MVRFPVLQAKILHGAGFLTSMQGNFNQAAPFLKKVRLRRKLRDRPGVIACLNNLGILALYRADYEQATIYLNESLSLRKQQGDKWVCAIP